MGQLKTGDPKSGEQCGLGWLLSRGSNHRTDLKPGNPRTNSANLGHRTPKLCTQKCWGLTRQHLGVRSLTSATPPPFILQFRKKEKFISSAKNHKGSDLPVSLGCPLRGFPFSCLTWGVLCFSGLGAGLFFGPVGRNPEPGEEAMGPSQNE